MTPDHAKKSATKLFAARISVEQVEEGVALLDSTHKLTKATVRLNEGIVTCKSIEDLSDIKKPEVDLVIWKRELPRHFHSWLEELKPSELPNFRILVEPTDLRPTVQAYFEGCGMPAGNNRDILLDDLDNLVSQFAGIAQCDLVDVRLERVQHNACWKFHRDFVEKRLLTTYLGPNTQWVQPQYAESALLQQNRFKGPIEDLAVDDVAIFKGSNIKPGNGIVHRSPPIEGTGLTRLLLCLNKQSFTSPDQWPDEA